MLMDIAIVGGTGGMGQVLVRELKPYANITIISRDLRKADQLSKKFGVQGGILNDCNTADIIIVSVPVENTPEICYKLFTISKTGSLIIDISAVKNFLLDLKPHIPQHISYISMHPLFGPEGSFRDHNVVLIPIKDNNWLNLIESLLHKLGSHIVTTSPEEHDFIMSKIQVAHHAIYLLLACYLNDWETSAKFFTRSFIKTLKNFKGIEKNLNVILEIQKFNPFANSTREELLLTLKTLLSLENEAEISNLLGKLSKFKTHFIEKIE